MTDKNCCAALLMLAFAQLLIACGHEDPAAALKREIGAMQTAVEQHKPADFLRYVSEDFSGQAGQIDRQNLRGLLVMQLMGSEKLAVTLAPAAVKVNGNEATVEVSALVVGGRYLPERGQTLSIKSSWRLQGSEWKCYAASWQ